MASKFSNDDDDGNEIRVVLIGKTGSGKSATCNTLLGEDIFESRASGASVTKVCSYYQAERFGKHVSVVDTPGIFDTGMDNELAKKEIVKCVGLTTPGPHVFLLAIKIGTRFTDEEYKAVSSFVQIFGEELYNFMIVVFTGKDALDRDNMDIDEYVRKTGTSELNSVLAKCNKHYLAIDNVQERYMRDRDAEKLFKDIAKMKRWKYYSNEIYREAEDMMKQKIQREIRCEMEQRIQEIDKEHKRAIREMEIRVRREEREKIANEDSGSLLDALKILVQTAWKAYKLFFGS